MPLTAMDVIIMPDGLKPNRTNDLLASQGLLTGKRMPLALVLCKLARCYSRFISGATLSGSLCLLATVMIWDVVNKGLVNNLVGTDVTDATTSWENFDLQPDLQKQSSLLFGAVEICDHYTSSILLIL